MLLSTPTARSSAWDTVLHWQHRVESLGHDLDDSADPVAATWHMLRMDLSPPEETLNQMEPADYGISGVRLGPALVESLRAVTGPGPRHQPAVRAAHDGPGEQWNSGWR